MYEHFKLYWQSGYKSGLVNIGIIAYLLKAFDYCIYVVKRKKRAWRKKRTFMTFLTTVFVHKLNDEIWNWRARTCFYKSF